MIYRVSLARVLPEDDGRHTIPLQVAEGHGFRGIQRGALFEIHAPGIHQLLALLPRGVYLQIRPNHRVYGPRKDLELERRAAEG